MFTAEKKKKERKRKEERNACPGSPHCKSGPTPLESMDLHRCMIEIDPTEFAVTQILSESLIHKF